MSRRSLRFRLLSAAAVSVAVALLIAGFSLVILFEHHVERRINAELDTYINQIVAGIGTTPNGRVTFGGKLADPRFEQPLSGLYWQVQENDPPTLLRSRSLWDDRLDLTPDELETGAIHAHELAGPSGQRLMVRERQVILQPGGEESKVRVAVALDRREVVEARNAFAADMLPYLGIMAAVLLLAAWLQVRIGLAPLERVRQGVAAIRSGRANRLDDDHPEEVMPLVEELNALLEARERAIERARDWTADLAHGLKTPLMVLTADAQRLREEGNTAIADDLDQLAESMRRRVDRELIRARVRSGARTRGLRANVGEAIDRIVRTLKRSPRSSGLAWSAETPPGTAAAILPDDLVELLGNLLENAAKWAAQSVSASVETMGDEIVITVRDDGPGVPAAQLESLGRRGLRLDERKPGFGLGLAIARDIVEAYGGEISFANSVGGGLAVAVRLPRAT